MTGYTPAFDDLYPLIACSSCTSDPVTAFDTVDIAPFTLARSADTVAVRGPELPVDLTFSLDRTSAASVRVGSSAIPVTELDRTAVVAAGGTASNVAASSVTLVGSEENAIADIELKDTLIADAILASPVLRSIPLVSIDIESEGGWSAIVAGVSDLAREPMTSLTLGQVLAAGVIEDPASPAGRVGALPLGAIDVEGTPLGRDPPRSHRSRIDRRWDAIPLDDDPITGQSPWCVVLEGFLGCRGDRATICCWLDLTATDVALRGAPLGAIPLGAIPLGAIGIAESPLGAIPLGAIDIAESPLGCDSARCDPARRHRCCGIAVGCDSVGCDSVGCDPARRHRPRRVAVGCDSARCHRHQRIRPGCTGDFLGGRTDVVGSRGGCSVGCDSAWRHPAWLMSPLGAIPLEENGVSVDWCDVLAEAAPDFSCNAADPRTTRPSLSWPCEGVPLGAIPLGAIPLGAIRSVPMDLGCDAVGCDSVWVRFRSGAIPLGCDPVGRHRTLVGTPLGAIPLGAIPLGAIDLAGTPLGAIPLGAIPLGAIPLGAIPLGAIPLGAIPVEALPLGAIDIAASPLGAIPVEGRRWVPFRWVRSRSVPSTSWARPCGAIPLGAIPLGAIAVDCAAGRLRHVTLWARLSQLVPSAVTRYSATLPVRSVGYPPRSISSGKSTASAGPRPARSH